MHAYKKLYEGPEFDIDYQYAQIWVLCMMAFLFGPLLPIMFLYGLLGFVVLYATNRIRVAYSVRRIPDYGDRMNKCMMYSLMIFPPMAYITVSAWLYSNQQVFENVVKPNKSHSAFNAPTGHEISLSFEQINPGTIFYYIVYGFMIWAAYRFVKFIIIKFPKINFCNLKVEKDKYDELDETFNQVIDTTFYDVLSDK